MRTKTNKKGSAFDMLFLVISLLSFAFIAILAFNVWDDMYQDRLNPGHPFNDSAASAGIAKDLNNANKLFDFIVPTFLVLGSAVIYTLVFRNPIPSGFLWLGILFGVVVSYFALFLRQAYVDWIASNANIAALVNANFPITDHIFRAFPAYVIVFFGIFTVVQYARSRSSVALV